MKEFPQNELVNHRVAIGNMVRLNKNVPMRYAVASAYEILAHLPERDGKLQYRIKSGSESYQRIVKEDELEPE